MSIKIMSIQNIPEWKNFVYKNNWSIFSAASPIIIQNGLLCAAQIFSDSNGL